MSEPSIAFLTIVDGNQAARIGGLLVTSHRGRPIEFHCTEPVTPNRAQQILYGPTLSSYLCGECIAPALMHKMKSQPQFVVTDVRDALMAREQVDAPVVALSTNVTAPAPYSLASFALGRHALEVHKDFPSDEATVTEAWASFDPWIDLEEPLERIRGAIVEAHRSAA